MALLKHGAKIFIILLVALVFFSISKWNVSAQDYADTDFFSYWLSGHMTLTGANPYAKADWVSLHTLYGADWVSDETFLYPLPLALFFAPLGLFSLYQAFILWSFLSLAMLAAVLILVKSMYQPWNWRPYLIPILSGLILFRPIFITIRFGQLGALLLLILTLSAYLLERRKWVAGGCVLGLLALKPNLGLPIILLVGLWFLMRKAWKPVLGVAITGVFLLVVGLICDPMWMRDYMEIGSSKISGTFYFTPTVWGASSYLCGDMNYPCTFTAAGIISAIILTGLLIFLFVNRKNSVRPVYILSLVPAVILAVAPYLWYYDQILLILPALAMTFELARRKYPFILASTLFLFFDLFILFLAVLSVRLQRDNFSVLIPLVMVVTVAWLANPPKARLSPLVEQD